MNIFSRFSTLLKSNINDLISRAENPEKMLNQIILDMREQLSKAKREVAAAIADERKLRSQLDDEVKQSRDWERRAMLAVKEGRDDLAKQALLRQQEHAQQSKVIEQTWQAQSAETEKLKGSLRLLNDKIEEAKRKRNLLIARQKRAQAQRRIHETMSGLSDTSAFEAFNRIAEKVEEAERRTLAQAEVTEALQGDTLEQQFLQLETGGDMDGEVEDRLLALKAEMGLIAAPDTAEPKKLGSGDEDDEGEPGEESAAQGKEGPVDQADGASSGENASGEGDEQIHEAELLEAFEKLEQSEPS